MNQVIEIITEDDAKKALRLWLREHKAQVVHWYSCQLWDYGDTPFWALIVKVYGFESPYDGVYGFQIYKGGIVLLVGKMSGY